MIAFEGTFEPGEVYELFRPLTVKAAEHAYIEDFIHRGRALAVGAGVRAGSVPRGGARPGWGAAGPDGPEPPPVRQRPDGAGLGPAEGRRAQL
ncbi:hypothetical protein [Streptomyces marianii]|uniref:Uncharacterized protein n=1 Tax=Streptomyces marianii TaxID=1817406 RepID=A0A5R9E5H3_9ACTN|nr:hypothetical protein [Streptomyces marianii]TLQ44209.1 hypothetical protein FEF34_14725 [Streptomyces marianii]